MSRDRTARTRIREYLRKHGPVEDATGYATSALKDAIQYHGTAVAFIQLIAAMDREGEIAREIKGKRTYRIALSRADQTALEVSPRVPAAAGGSLPAPLVAIDYDRLARALVREFFLHAAPGAAVQNTVARDTVTRNSAGSEPVERLRAERDEYALLLEIARLRLGALLGGHYPEDETALLRHLSA